MGDCLGAVSQYIIAGMYRYKLWCNHASVYDGVNDSKKKIASCATYAISVAGEGQQVLRQAGELVFDRIYAGSLFFKYYMMSTDSKLGLMKPEVYYAVFAS